jgi:septal ring factor EnvC (AmiA/AmiB activator)
MVNFNNFARFLLICSFIVTCCVTGCTRRPKEEDLTKLEEARSAAESAERKLAELRQERQDLENQLSKKQAELSQHEAERDEIRQKMENQ